MNNTSVIIYDGQCSLCCGCMKWIELHAICKDDFEFIMCQSESWQQRFPEISEDKCRKSFHLILSSGQVLIGDHAIPEIIKRLKRFHWLSPFFKLPLSKHIMFVIYRFISNNRYIISQTILPLVYNKSGK